MTILMTFLMGFVPALFGVGLVATAIRDRRQEVAFRAMSRL